MLIFFSKVTLIAGYLFSFCFAAQGTDIEKEFNELRQKKPQILRQRALGNDWKAQYIFGEERNSRQTANMQKEAVQWWVAALQNETLDNQEIKDRLLNAIIAKIRSKPNYKPQVEFALLNDEESRREKQKTQELTKRAGENDQNAIFKLSVKKYYGYLSQTQRLNSDGFSSICKLAKNGHEPSLNFLCRIAKEVYGIS